MVSRSGLPSIGWVTGAGEDVASYRLRCAAPRKYLEDKGHVCGKGVGDITILLKVCVENPEEIVEHKDRSILVWDVCDDHFDTKWASYYRKMCRVVHYVTCSTPVMAERVRKETGVTATVISDPLEYPQKQPRVNDPIKLLWYGHKSNMRALYAVVDRLKGYKIKALTSEEVKSPGCYPWSHEAMKHGLAWCDAVIIPISEPVNDQPRKEAKSPNRMTEAINAGRYVIANDMPAYRGFDMWLGDIQEGLHYMQEHQAECLSNLTKAQKLVTQRHSPAVIGGQWGDFLDSIWAAETSIGKAS